MSRTRTTILLVEDSATQALDLTERLENDGYEVIYADSAKAASEALVKSPDLIVLDYYLPDMRGDELCRRLRLQLSTRAIPVLLFTSAEDAVTERQGLESGADDYLPKSAPYAMLLQRIEVLLRRTNVYTKLTRELGIASLRPRVLIVDDSATYTEFLRQALDKDGYEIATVATGREAVEAFAGREFDAVILDLALPDKGGLDVCRELSALQAARGNPSIILVMTGSVGDGVIAEALLAGADDAVLKSHDFGVAQARLRALLRRRLLYRENERIAAEMRARELAALKAQAEKESLMERAELADSLEKANRELKEAQAQLVQTAKMAALGGLVAGGAHEINNPVSFAIAHAGTIADCIDKALAENIERQEAAALDKAQDRLAELRKGLERVEDLVTKLRTFSRLDEGERKRIDIHESIEAALALLAHRLRGKIELHREYAAEPMIDCMPGPLNQVLMNVIVNAIDAMGGQGTLRVSTRTADGTLSVTVADSGRGIPKELIDRVFEPFFTTKPPGQGTGLGLAISYRIVETHGGTIRIDSEPGAGTQVTLCLPQAYDGGAAADVRRSADHSKESDDVAEAKRRGSGA